MAETRIGISSRSSRSSSIHPAEMQSTPAMAHTSVVYADQTKEFKKWRPWLVLCFVIANVAVFVVTMYVNDCPKNSGSCVAGFLGRFSFQPLKENPLLGPSSATLQKMGALDAKRVVERHQGWRLVTCNWLHGGLLHLLANMLGLLVIGIRLEREFGFVRIGLLYVISGFGGSLLSGLFLQSNISVGASGALFGLLGSMLSELITNWSIYANKVAAFLTLIIIIVVNLAVGILPHVDNFAHIGGFVSGFLLGFVFLIRPQFGWVSQQYASAGLNHSTRPRYKTYQCALWVVSLVLLIAGFAIALILLLRGFNANDHCSWCHYLSCVPTSRWSCNNGPSYCMTDQLGNQVNITCSNSGKSGTYILADATSSRIQSLCSQLCT